MQGEMEQKCAHELYFNKGYYVIAAKFYSEDRGRHDVTLEKTWLLSNSCATHSNLAITYIHFFGFSNFRLIVPRFLKIIPQPKHDYVKLPQPCVLCDKTISIWTPRFVTNTKGLWLALSCERTMRILPVTSMQLIESSINFRGKTECETTRI
jgi:hypothetical protein